MKREELDNMWAEIQLNADAANFRGEEYIAICWTIEDNGLAIIMDYTETPSASKALREFSLNDIATRGMCKDYKFKRPVYAMCNAIGRLQNGHYILLEQCTREVETYSPKITNNNAVRQRRI